MPDPSRLLTGLANALAQIAGVEAVVLGGSRARGTHAPNSDIDIGIYYAAAEQFDLVALDRLAAALDDRHHAGLVTPLGGWGPWINGGGWLTVEGWHVDFLYRELPRVQAIVDDCREGRFEFAYQPGHPHGFPSYIYMGEIAVCRPLWDHAGAIAALKAQVVPYPPLLRRAILDRFYWEANFSLETGAKAASRGDASYVAGCCFRCVACLTQCLFALNGEYWLNEKGAVAQAASFVRAPQRYAERVNAAFALLSAEPASLSVALAELRSLNAETARLL